MVRKLFIAPPTIPQTTYTRCLQVPASQEWLAVFNAALLTMSDPNNYEQLNETDPTPEDCASRGLLAYEGWLVGDCVNCNDVIACLPELSGDVQQRGIVNPNSVDPSDDTVVDVRFPPATRGLEILPPPAECDLDEMWAGILEIITRIDGNGKDFWETVVAETDKITRIAEMIALVPLFGDLVGEGLELLADVAPTMLTNYNAFSSQSAIEEIACDVFQVSCSLCRYPTYQELYDYYAGNTPLGAANWQDIALDALIDVLIGTSTASPAIVYFTTNIVQLWVMSLAATWVRTTGVKFIAMWARLGASSPSDAWELLCGPCEQPSPCAGLAVAMATQRGCQVSIDPNDECLWHVTSGPQQSDADYYISLKATDGRNFKFTLENPVGLSFVNARWYLDGATGLTNYPGIQNRVLDEFYIRSNNPWTVDFRIENA